jgi:hypothetical protein
MATSSTPAVQTTATTQFVGQDVKVGSAAGTVGFFGKTPIAQPTSASITDYATLKVALQNLGLIGA